MDQEETPVTGRRARALASVASVLRCAAATLVVLGSGAAAVAGYLPRQPAVPEPPEQLAIMWVALPALLVALAVIWMRGRGDPDDGWHGLRTCSVLLAAAVAAPVWWTFGDAATNLASGLPVLGPMLFAIGFTSVFVGALLLVVLGPPRPAAKPTMRPRLVGAGAGVLAVAAAMFASVVAVHIEPLDATTATASEPAVMPTDPHHETWSWDAPDGQRVEEVVTAGTGVVVMVGDGVIAIDGATGEERWHYRRTGSHATGLGASPDGRLLLVSFKSAAEDAEGVRVISLDAMTGAEAGFDEVTEGGVFGGVRLEMTEHVLLGGDRDEGVFRGYDLRGDERLWEYHKPDTCLWSSRPSEPVVGRDVVLFGLVCGPEEPRSENVTVTVTLLALDDRTGAERWRFERKVPALARRSSGPDGDFWDKPGWNIDQSLELASDRSAASLGWTDSETGAEDRYLIDAATGEVLLQGDALPAERIVEFSKEWLVTDPETEQDPTGRYTMTMIGSGNRRTVGETPLPDASFRWFTHEVALGTENSLDAYPDTEGTLSIVPWDGAPGREIDVHFGPTENYDDPELELAPGAIVAWHRDTERIVGIA